LETGLINIDFADAEAIMRDQGDALMAIGFGAGENRAVDAATGALDNPLLEDTSIKGANKVLIYVAGGNDFALTEFDEICNIITADTDPNAIIKTGLYLDSSMDDKVRVTVIATGFETAARLEAVKRQKLEQVRTNASDFVTIEEFQNMKERSEQKSCLPHRGGYDEEDLDVPTLLRDRRFTFDDDKNKPRG
jgi:cell division protein FtsZ